MPCPLTYDGNLERGAGYALGDHEQKDGEGEKHRDPARDLLSCLRQEGLGEVRLDTLSFLQKLTKRSTKEFIVKPCALKDLSWYS